MDIEIGDKVILNYTAYKEGAIIEDAVNMTGTVIFKYACSGRLKITLDDNNSFPYYTTVRLEPCYLDLYIGIGHQLLLFGDL